MISTIKNNSLTEYLLIPVRANDEDSKDHNESGRNEKHKDAPPPEHHLLLLPEKCPEKEQEGKLDADNGNSKE